MQVTVQIIRICIYLLSLVFYCNSSCHWSKSTPPETVHPFTYTRTSNGAIIPAIWELGLPNQCTVLVLCGHSHNCKKGTVSPMPWRCSLTKVSPKVLPWTMRPLYFMSLGRRVPADVSLADVSRPWATYRRLKITTNRRNLGDQSFAYLTLASTLTVPTIALPT
jgi:hypothetical protein